VEAAYLRLFEAVGEGLGLLHCGLEMIFGGFPLFGGRCGGTRDRVREVGWAKAIPHQCRPIRKQVDKALQLAIVRPG
jgi:hypothetical protein